MPVTPKRSKGPPLNALRAFEAAARYQSFVLAAEELMVSPGAISQHVKALEEWAGLVLFVRNAKGVRLSQEGPRIAPNLIAAFDQLGQAVRGLQDLSQNAICGSPLCPRLPSCGFHRACA
ncbi:MAG: LysR family transcriptional regulator [Pelagimonas sp.]|nr:LysR family transcriptional regulator [Pelagimonas sp.]